MRYIARLILWLFATVTVIGKENIPAHGPLLVVTNHLGDADSVLALAITPIDIEWLAKVELYEYPVLGKIMDAYGVIWIHRGQPDRTALKAAMAGLSTGRFVGVAPEGRESLTGALEEGTHGAAYLAMKANVPILPLTFTGTENKIVYNNIKRLKRSRFTITYGTPFRLVKDSTKRSRIQEGTQTIMEKLAGQLPAKHRGAYQIRVDKSNGNQQH